MEVDGPVLSSSAVTSCEAAVREDSSRSSGVPKAKQAKARMKSARQQDKEKVRDPSSTTTTAAEDAQKTRLSAEESTEAEGTALSNVNNNNGESNVASEDGAESSLDQKDTNLSGAKQSAKLSLDGPKTSTEVEDEDEPEDDWERLIDNGVSVLQEFGSLIEYQLGIWI